MPLLQTKLVGEKELSPLSTALMATHCYPRNHIHQQTERSWVRMCSQPTGASTNACFQAWLLRHQPSGASSADRKEFGQDVFTAMFPSMAASSSTIRCFVSRQKGVWSGRVHRHVSKHGCFIINHPALRQQTERSSVRTCSQPCFQAWLPHHQPSGASLADRKEFGQDVFTAMFPSMAASSSTIRCFVSRQKGVWSGRVHSHVSKHGCSYLPPSATAHFAIGRTYFFSFRGVPLFFGEAPLVGA